MSHHATTGDPGDHVSELLHGLHDGDPSVGSFSAHHVVAANDYTPAVVANDHTAGTNAEVKPKFAELHPSKTLGKHATIAGLQQKSSTVVNQVDHILNNIHHGSAEKRSWVREWFKRHTTNENNVKKKEPTPNWTTHAQETKGPAHWDMTAAND